MRLALIHAIVWSVAMWATSPDGDCTKSGDCKQGEYCKAGTCVPKRPSEGATTCRMISTTAN